MDEVNSYLELDFFHAKPMAHYWVAELNDPSGRHIGAVLHHDCVAKTYGMQKGASCPMISEKASDNTFAYSRESSKTTGNA